MAEEHKKTLDCPPVLQTIVGQPLNIKDLKPDQQLQFTLRFILTLPSPVRAERIQEEKENLKMEKT